MVHPLVIAFVWTLCMNHQIDIAFEDLFGDIIYEKAGKTDRTAFFFIFCLQVIIWHFKLATFLLCYFSIDCFKYDFEA